MDLFADGRSAEKTAKLSEQNDYPAFSPLPADDAQAKSGWQFTENEANQKAYQVKQAGKPWIIESTRQGIFHDIYQMGETETIYFDDKLGLVTKIDSKNEQGYGFNGHGTGLVELKTHAVWDKDWIAQLVSDANTVDKAKAATEDALSPSKPAPMQTPPRPQRAKPWKPPPPMFKTPSSGTKSNLTWQTWTSDFDTISRKTPAKMRCSTSPQQPGPRPTWTDKNTRWRIIVAKSWRWISGIAAAAGACGRCRKSKPWPTNFAASRLSFWA